MPPTHVQMSLNWAQGHHGGPDWPKNDCLISVRNDRVPDVLWGLLLASHIQKIDGMKPAPPYPDDRSKGNRGILLAPVSVQLPVKEGVLVSLSYWCLSLFRSVVTLLVLAIYLSSRLANPLVAVTNCLACGRGGKLSSKPLFEGIVHHGGDFAYFLGGARIFHKETENI